VSSDPSVARIISVATAIGPLANDVVFIGGAIAPLLHTEATLPRARPTKDVDAVVASHSYGDSESLDRTLRNLGFVHVMELRAHAHRWRSPAGILLDLVPAGAHLGGSGNPWDALALQSAVSATIDGVTFRHASAAAFIALKLEAFNDRGGGDWRGSHDIEDIVALIASRPSIAEDVSIAPTAIAARIRTFASALLSGGVVDEILSAHLNNAYDPEEAVGRARARLSDILLTR
jgi:predicted nucleotidyltransferase